MANLSIIGSPSTTNNNLIVSYSTDISDITNIEISNNGSNYISATTFSNSSATFDVSSWKNGTYNSCTLRVTYGKTGEETQLLINNIGNITQTVGNSFYIKYSTNKAVTKHEVSWDGGSTFHDKTSDVTSSGNNYSFKHDDKASAGTYRMAIRVTTSSGETKTSNIFTVTITSGVSVDTYYTVKYNLNNASSSNTNTTVKKGSSYSTTISPASNYRIKTIYCVMGGTDISSSTVSGNNINIPNVTGEINITVTTEAISSGGTDTYYPVNYHLHNATSTNSATSIKKGSSYSTTVAPESGYRITKIYCVMNGDDISDSTVNGNNVYIDNVIGEIHVTVYTEAISGTKIYTVTRNVTNCISTGSDTLDTSITTTFQSVVAPNDGYTLKTLTVSMGGIDYTNETNVITDTEWNGKPAKLITIKNVNGNIVINAVAESETTKPDIPDTPIVDDILEILPSCTYIDIAEGGSKTIYFKLSNKPTSSTTINISSSSSYLTLSTSQLTFTADNYHIAQSVNVTSISDNNKTDDIYNINVSANGLTSKTITVDVIDSANSNFEVIYDNGTLVNGASFSLSNAVNNGTYISTNQSQDVSVGISNHPLSLNKNDKVHVVLGLGTSDPSSIYSLRSLILGDGSANNISNSNMINEVQINEALSSDGKVDTYWTIAGNLSNITLTFTCYFARVNIYKIYIERGK